MTFEELNLNTPLLNALNDLGYTTPTTIQKKAYPVVMSGKDVCGIAQTGTGKTFAYLLPGLRQYQFSKDKNPQLLIVVPTRELVAQVVESVQHLVKYISLKVVGVYGGVNIKQQVAELADGTDVLVGTPGRLIDLLAMNVVKTKSIKKLVIDEVDEMLSLGFRPQLSNILDLLPQKRQNLLFSATLTDEVEEIMNTYFNQPVRIEAAPAGTPLDNIAQSAFHVPNFYTKINLLELLLAKPAETSKVLIFVGTKQLADQLYEELEMEFSGQLGVIHSNKSQNNRFDTIKNFQNGTYRILIATDIVARGLDISEVSHVINFDLPEVPENYIHRIGRTGRQDKKGIAISFLIDKDEDAKAAIEELMSYKIPLLPLPEQLEISDKFTEDEMPKVIMKEPILKRPKKEYVGPAFHEKSEKNKKVNVRRDHEAEKKKKYGKSYEKRSRK